MSHFWWALILGGCLLTVGTGLLLVATIQTRRGVRCQSRNSHTTPPQINTITRELVHEIRNPLNSINLNLQLLEEDLSADPVEQKEDLQRRVRRIRGEIERLNQILADFRRYAQLPPLSLETYNPAVLIEEVLNFNEPEAQNRNIEVVRDIHSLPPIQLDAKQFKGALFNLIINANQAMENGGRLTIRAKPLNEHVQIEVEDTGKGIEPQLIDKIFDMFISTKEDGTGVGLTIVKMIIEGHGGQIQVKSQPNRGTTFLIRLPVRRA